MAVRDPNMTREGPMKTIEKVKNNTLLVAQELQLIRVLAGNNGSARNKALKALKSYFKHRSIATAFTEEDYQRIWKGLFYTLWMSDKPLKQEECAENIATLIHHVPEETVADFTKAGFVILANEWFGIDQLRLDKFLMFVRRFLRQNLIYLKNHKWHKDAIKVFSEVLGSTVLSSTQQQPLGLVLHFIEIFLEELSKVSESELNTNHVCEFLQPFSKLLAYSKDIRIIKQIKKHVYERLMEQSDTGLDYKEKYEQWRQLGFPGTLGQIQKVPVENDGNHVENDDSDEQAVEEKVWDPRAGHVDVELPQITFNPKVLAQLLDTYKSDNNTNAASRRAINELIKEFGKLSRGVFPLGVNTVAKIRDDDLYNVRKSAKKLIQFDNKIKGKQKKRKTDQDPVELRSGKKIKLETDLATKLSQELQEICEKSPKMKLKKKKSDLILSQDTELLQTRKRKRKDLHQDAEQQELEAIFKRNSGTWFVFKMAGSEDSASSDVPETPQRRITPIRVVEESNIPTKPNKKLGSKVVKRSPGKSPKRVKINTKLNSSQEIQEHHAQILSSPAIPYDANKKPIKPLLKIGAVPSPINPFYSRKLTP